MLSQDLCLPHLEHQNIPFLVSSESSKIVQFYFYYHLMTANICQTFRIFKARDSTGCLLLLLLHDDWGLSWQSPIQLLTWVDLA